VLGAHCLVVKFLPLSRELSVIGCPKTQTASLRIIIVQRNLCFMVPLAHRLIIYLVLPFQVSHFRPQFPQNPRIPILWITSLFLSTPTKLSFCPCSPIMTALPRWPPLNLRLSQWRRLWIRAPSLRAKGQSWVRDKTEVFPLTHTHHARWLAWLRSETHTYTHPSAEVHFALPINFPACVFDLQSDISDKSL
jgi:hypothetical protein